MKTGISKITVFNAHSAAVHWANIIANILERDSTSISPGQWMIVAKYDNTVFVDEYTKKEFAVRDYF